MPKTLQLGARENQSLGGIGGLWVLYSPAPSIFFIIEFNVYDLTEYRPLIETHVPLRQHNQAWFGWEYSFVVRQNRETEDFEGTQTAGRSFQIGLALVTQRPSGIDDNILSQCDNFATLRLTFEEDVKDLVKASGGAFTGYESDIQNLERGQAVVAFGEPCKVQPVQFFEWTEERASSRLSEETTQPTILGSQAIE